MPTLPELPSKLNETADARCYGLRVERHLLQLAIATRMDDGRYKLAIDQVSCSDANGWLSATGFPLLIDALDSLAERHQLRNGRVAISLDGHYCVTRVTMGTMEEVDSELEMQATRVPRYLQLGPGEKVTGCSRQKIANSDYAVTGVVNRSIIQRLYDAIREVDIDVTWVEPSLVSVARMLGQAQVGGDNPIMIADGTGSHWDVGIACSGRLLLDYRPAGAKDEEGLRQALDGHITRLKRFCLRHRGIATGEMNRLMICGSGDKPANAIEVLGDSLGIQPEILRVPNLTNLYELEPEKRKSRSVPAVATVLPLLTGVSNSEVPDLLTEVRRAPDLPFASRFVRSMWPVFAACIALAISFGMVTRQRSKRVNANQRAQIVAKLTAADSRFEELSHQRELLGHLQQIKRATKEHDWTETFRWTVQSLPALAKLDEFRVDSDGTVLVDGAVMHEPLIFELVGNLRQLPNVHEVALTGTTPNESISGIQFNIRMELNAPELDLEDSADWERDHE
ncbi:MAG: hypothetical protein AAGG48_05830 [Planctomycetota bacterium]